MTAKENKLKNIIDALQTWDSADYLKTEESITAYLAEFSDDTDPVLLAHVQDNVARARARIAAAERDKQ
jgi:DNA-binding phage protein